MRPAANQPPQPDQSPLQPLLALRAAVGRVRRRLVWLAAQQGAARGAVVGLALGCLLLLARELLALPWPAAAALLALVGSGLAAGALGGVAAALRGPARPLAAARAADRDLGLADRLSTALELAKRGEHGPFAEACLLDAASAAETVDAGRVGRRQWPREARLAPPLALLAVLLLVLPPVPLARVYDAVVAAGQLDAAPDAAKGAGEEPRPDKKPAPDLSVKEAFRREAAEGSLPRTGESLNLATLFKDTKMSSVRPDSNAFLGGADDRLKLLQQLGSLPDLKQQPAGPGYQLRLKRMQEMMTALGNGGISKREFMELTERLKRMGERSRARGDGFDRALQDGVEAFEAGETGEAYASMQRALDHLLGDGAGEGENTLPPSTGDSGGGEHDDLTAMHGGAQAEDGAAEPPGRSGGQQEQGPAGGRGSEAGSGGRGKKGGGGEEPPEWAGRNDSFVEGMLSAGESEAYDSNVPGRGAPGTSRLPFMNVFNEYRRQVEETLIKESVPLDARERVRTYFRSLEE